MTPSDTNNSNRGAGCNPRGETFRAWFDQQRQPTLSTLVIETVADALGVDPVTLPRFYDVIDADALERLFAPRDGTGRSPDTVRFRYVGCTVTVSGDGVITVTPPE